MIGPGALTLRVQPKSVGFIDRDKGTNLHFEWRLLRGSSAGDSYEFKITPGINAAPIVKRVRVANEPIELIRNGEVIVTIKQNVSDEL